MIVLKNKNLVKVEECTIYNYWSELQKMVKFEKHNTSAAKLIDLSLRSRESLGMEETGYVNNWWMIFAKIEHQIMC